MIDFFQRHGRRASRVPAVEEYGVEPIPAELRTTRWRDLFAINFTFFLNPVMYVLGAIAVAGFGLPLWWAILAMVLGQALAYAVMVPIAEVGVDYGLTGQVAARATLGFWGARLLSSPYRVIAATYWFAAQAIAAAYAIQAVVQAMGGGKPPLVPVALGVALFHATLAVLGFDVMRWLLRVVLPLSLAFVGVMVALYASTDDPRFDVGRVFDSPDQHLTWVGLRRRRHADGRLEPDPRHERRRLLPLHADAPRRADRPGRLGARRRRSSTRSSAAMRPRRPARRTPSSRSPT